MNRRMSEPRIVTAQDVADAVPRIAPFAAPTPLLRAYGLDAQAGATVYVKAECLQRGGAFKFRGAVNRLRRAAADALAHGVVAFSSGNHAAAVAEAARLNNVRATIVMPKDAPTVKIARTRDAGAEIVFFDRALEDREAIARNLARERNSLLIPSFDDPDVVAGQGTCGYEILQQCEELGVAPDRVLVCCGGGGLTAGVAAGVAAAERPPKVVAVEAEAHAGMAASLRAGHVVAAPPPDHPSICDAIQSQAPGATPFLTAQAHGVEAVAVTDRAVKQAMAVAADVLKLVLEPGGAVALAALLAKHAHEPGETVVVVASGGNVDLDRWRAWTTDAA